MSVWEKGLKQALLGTTKTEPLEVPHGKLGEFLETFQGKNEDQRRKEGFVQPQKKRKMESYSRVKGEKIFFPGKIQAQRTGFFSVDF